MRNSLALLALILFFSGKLMAQSSYNNDWIDYSKTYYKFKVGTFGNDFEGVPIKKGVVRINRAALVSAGLSQVAAQDFQLWRNGKEIPIYTSKATGILGGSDYIEFWGEAADGKPDRDLYRDSTFQLSNYWSLETDSAAYFLTSNTTGPNKRLETTANSVGAATIQPEQNFMYTLGKYYREQINPGFGVVSSQTLYSSAYDRGEGFSSQPSGGFTSWSYSGLYADVSGPTMTARINLVGIALNPRKVEFVLNTKTFPQFQMNYFGTATMVYPGLDPNLLSSDGAFFGFSDITPASGDNFVISQIELDYPRKFNFGGKAVFEFSLPASDTGRYLKITNFSDNGSTPVLYDIANGKRYAANTSVAGTLRFLLQPSTQKYQLVLVRGDGSTATSITAFQKKKFTDYTIGANQGDYLIITNPVLYGSGQQNYIEQYRAYRSSDTGGGFKAKIIDVSELEDQFAYGIQRHPLAVKNFLSFARNKFAVAPAFAFLIGKGLEYNVYRLNESDPLVAQTGLVPTFGNPGSDNLLSSDNYDPIPATAIGRLSAVTPKEVGDYLAKIKQYEAAQQDSVQTAANKGWMKNVLQLTGVNDAALGQELDQYMADYKSIIQDTLFGANVTTFSKSADPSAYPQEVSSFTNIYNQGSALVTYFGHSSSRDLDFSLDQPDKYNNTGRYPIFIVNGCLAGNIFDYDAGRLSNLSTISEKFVLAPQKGAIGYLSTSSFGVVNYLDIFTKEFYKSIGVRQYSKGFGVVVRDGISAALNITGTSDFYGRTHAEQYTFHGDPALKINSFARPDYSIVSSGVTISPSFISVADDSFTVKIVITNIGKAISDSVHFSLSRTLDAKNVNVFSTKLGAIKTADSVTVKIPIIPNRDNGVVHLTAFIDDDGKINELSEDNNILQIPVTISSADIRPVYPYNYAIVTAGQISFAASTANPLDTSRKYTMQLDTTALFNSPVKTQSQVISKGGVIQYQNITLPLDNTVYYWRVAPAGTDNWNMFSFMHSSAGAAGFEQAHFYQHTKSSFSNMLLDSASRSFKFGKSPLNLFVRQGIYPYSGSEDADFSVAVNGTFIAQSACVGNSIIFNVFDPLTFKVYANPGGSCKPITVNNFEISVADPGSRKNAVAFLNNFVHDGDYVVARSIDVPNAKAPQWAADSTIYGHNTLYQYFKDQGIDIDKYSFPRCYIFVFKKNDSAHFTPVSVYSDGYYDAISYSQNISVYDTIGYVSSPKFGPGKKWNSVSWQGADSNSNNISEMNVIGVDKNNKETTLYTLDKTQHTQNLSGVNANTYPYIKLQMRSQDSLTAKPYQLHDWSVLYEPVAEGAIAPNIGVNLPDTLKFPHAINTKADTLQGYVVFKNVSITDFDSLKVKLLLTDSVGTVYPFVMGRTKPLVAGDTVIVQLFADLTAVPEGEYNLYLQVNPDNDQAEQYLFNNSLYKYVYVNRSETVPTHLLTFTGQPDGKGVMLRWKATNELNFSSYGVQHSADGRNFVQVGSVAALGGNITDIKNYSFLHAGPVQGRNYYRLKQVDIDGRFSYSKVVTVDFGGAVVRVYPNPFTTSLQVAVNSTGTGMNTVKVLDLAGRVMLQKTFTGGTTALDVSRLAAGTYVVQVNGTVALQSFKVQKQSK